MRNLTFMLWLVFTLFVVPVLEYVSGYMQYVATTYSDDVNLLSALFTLAVIVGVATLLYEKQ